MKVEKLLEIIDADFYVGVPDSQLKSLCSYLMNKYGIDKSHHIIAANEGNAVAIAAGAYLATEKIPVVYMQNSGEGNIINPLASLLNEKVYKIPMIFIIGWRGEPGVGDEPQHVYQGEVTLKLLDDMEVENFIISEDTTEEEVQKTMDAFRQSLTEGKDVAFVIRKNALSTDAKVKYENDYSLCREEIIRHIVRVSGDDPIVSTTGKASRELFEIREELGQGHEYDFLTVGSMGHASSIALGIAINKPNRKVWCVDGDGAMLMHMGALAVIGNSNPGNLIHIVINNGAHESVGGMPTVATGVDVVNLAKACGYKYAVSVKDFENLDEQLNRAKREDGLSLIEVKCSIGARADLGRPTKTPQENKEDFIKYLNSLE